MDINDTFRGIDQNKKDDVKNKKEIKQPSQEIDFQTFKTKDTILFNEQNFEDLLCPKKKEPPEISSEDENRELLNIIN